MSSKTTPKKRRTQVDRTIEALMSLAGVHPIPSFNAKDIPQEEREEYLQILKSYGWKE